MTVSREDMHFARLYAQRLSVGGVTTADLDRMAKLLPFLLDELTVLGTALDEAQAEVRRLDRLTGWWAAHGRTGW